MKLLKVQNMLGKHMALFTNNSTSGLFLEQKGGCILVTPRIDLDSERSNELNKLNKRVQALYLQHTVNLSSIDRWSKMISEVLITREHNLQMSGRRLSDAEVLNKI